MFPRSARSAPGRHGQAGWPFELWETPRLGAFWESGPLGQDRHGFYLFSADGGVSPSPTHLGGVTDVLRNSQGSQSAGSSAGPAEAPTGHCVASGAGEPRWDQQAPSCAEPCWALEPLFVATEPVPGERSGAADPGSQVAASLRVSPRGHRVSVAAGPCWAGEVPVTQASLPWARRPLDGLLRWLQCRGAARRSPEHLTFPQIAMELLCLVGLGWGCWLGRAWEAVCVSNLTMRHSLC